MGRGQALGARLTALRASAAHAHAAHAVPTSRECTSLLNFGMDLCGSRPLQYVFGVALVWSTRYSPMNVLHARDVVSRDVYSVLSTVRYEREACVMRASVFVPRWSRVVSRRTALSGLRGPHAHASCRRARDQQNNHCSSVQQDETTRRAADKHLRMNARSVEHSRRASHETALRSGRSCSVRGVR